MNYRSSNIGSVLGLFLLFFPFVSLHAEGPVIRSGDSVSIDANQVLEGDFYSAGENISLSGEAERDAYLAGDSVTINAPIGEDLTAIGRTIQVHGTVGDDVRVAGGKVVIAAPVADDVVVIGASVHILSTASIGGDLIIVGGEFLVDGPVAGTIYGNAERVRVDAPVGGSIDVDVAHALVFGDRAEIAGNVNYRSTAELTRAQDAVIMGNIMREVPTSTYESSWYRELGIAFLVLVFSSLSLFFVLGSRTEKLVHVLYAGYGKFSLVGLGMILALPLVALVLIMSGIGAVVGVTLILLYTALVLGSVMFVPVVVGSLVQRVARLGASLSVFTLILGVCVAGGVTLVPVVGPFLLLLVFLSVVGTFCNECYHFFRRS